MDFLWFILPFICFFVCSWPMTTSLIWKTIRKFLVCVVQQSVRSGWTDFTWSPQDNGNHLSSTFHMLSTTQVISLPYCLLCRGRPNQEATILFVFLYYFLFQILNEQAEWQNSEIVSMETRFRILAFFAVCFSWQFQNCEHCQQKYTCFSFAVCMCIAMRIKLILGWII